MDFLITAYYPLIFPSLPGKVTEGLSGYAWPGCGDQLGNLHQFRNCVCILNLLLEIFLSRPARVGVCHPFLPILIIAPILLWIFNIMVLPGIALFACKGNCFVRAWCRPMLVHLPLDKSICGTDPPVSGAPTVNCVLVILEGV